LAPNHSPWRQVHEIGDHESFPSVTNFSHEEFEEMHHDLYQDHLERHGAGRHKLLKRHDELSFILIFWILYDLGINLSYL